MILVQTPMYTVYWNDCRHVCLREQLSSPDRLYYANMFRLNCCRCLQIPSKDACKVCR